MLKRAIVVVLLVTDIMPVFANTFYAMPSIIYQNTYSGDINNGIVAPRVALGYGGSFGSAPLGTPGYIAGEVFLSPGSGSIHENAVNGLSLRTTYHYGVSVIPGIYLDDYIMAFARLGAIWSRFSKIAELDTGYQAGLGAEVKIDELAPWRVRGEYVYTRYRTMSGVGAPQAGQFGLGAVYDFNF